MKATIFKLFYLLCLILIITGCEEADTTAPQILVTQPAQNDTIHAGEQLCIQVTFTDDAALNSYKINIHPNFNGHKHIKRPESAIHNSDQSTEDFEITVTSQMRNDILTGKNCFRDIDIDIPANATQGIYHLLIYCTDLAGNEAYTAQELVIN